LELFLFIHKTLEQKASSRNGMIVYILLINVAGAIAIVNKI